MNSVNLFARFKFSTKLLTAFLLCAFITLSVGLVGMTGTARLTDMLSKIFSQNLVAVSGVAEALGGVASHNRGLYRLLSAERGGATQGETQRLRTELEYSKGATERALSSLGELHEGVAEASVIKVAQLWPEYVASSTEVMSLIRAGDYDRAMSLLDDRNASAFRAIRDTLRVMVEANNEQIKDGAALAHELERSVFIRLVIGVTIAFSVALMIGIFITRMITSPLRAAVLSAERIANGDLTHSVVASGTDEAGQLLKALGNMQSNLRDTLLKIADEARRLVTAAEELMQVTEKSTMGLARQNGEIEQAATAVNQMTAAVEEVASNAVSTSEASRSAASEAEDGRSQVHRVVAGIDIMQGDLVQSDVVVTELAGRVRGISSVLDVIRTIAEQTNLLALNAAIEAARAGAQGRGFAVVADEVRALAHRTQASTLQIESMIGSVIAEADGAVAAMRKSLGTAASTQDKARLAGLALEQITCTVFQINERNLLIAAASEQQAQVAREVDRNLINIRSLSEETSVGATRTGASSQQLAGMAASFNVLVGKFKL